MIIKILQCSKLIKKQYNNILDYNGDQLKFTVTKIIKAAILIKENDKIVNKRTRRSLMGVRDYC